MKINDILWLSYKDLGEKKVRTALTVLMVMIGVATIIALVSQTEGISASIQSQLQSLGTTSILLMSTKPSGFTITDTAAISGLKNVSEVIPILTGSATLSENNQNSSVTIVGISSENLNELIGGINLYQGSVYADGISPAALVGYSVAFPTSGAGKQEVTVGSSAMLKISSSGFGSKSSSYTVPITGVLQEYGSSLIPIDTGVIISLEAAELLLHKTSFNVILVKATNSSGVGALSTTLTNIYGTNARVITTQQLAATASSIIGSITFLLVVIASISLLVAAVGIMNIMLMAVLERTHEIGILKAVGFKNQQVLAIFLLQALIIGFAGGILGIGLGVGASYGIAAAISGAQSSSASTSASSSTAASAGGATVRSGSGGFGGGSGSFSGTSGRSAASTTSAAALSYKPVLTPITIIEAMLVAVIVSAVAGIYPAWRASQMEPIEALRQL